MLDKKPSPEIAKNAIHALSNLLEETEFLINSNDIGFSPVEGSKGYIEVNTFKRGESISTALSQGASLIEASADHLLALVRTLTEPMLSIASWSCARSALEACALSGWLLDPKIDSKSRVQRSLAFRYENLVEQIKIARLQKNHVIESKLIQRITDIEDIAIGLGFEKVLDKKGKRIGIGSKMPDATKLIGEILNEEYTYRILSGIVHGQSWALQSLSFRLKEDYEALIQKDPLPIGARLIERNLEPSHIVYFCGVLAKAFMKTVYFASIMFGWDQEHLELIIKEQFPKLGINNYELNI